MRIHFTKMHSLGNDFMVIDGITQAFSPDAALIARLADRHTGIGFDQCLLIEKSPTADADFFYRIFNADGGEVGQCGNGARCLVKFAHQRGLTTQSHLTLQTKTSLFSVELHPDGTATACFAPPRFDAAAIPLHPEALLQVPMPFILRSDRRVLLYLLNVGNPHAVLRVEDWTAVDVAGWGREISENGLFPEQTNVTFMQMLSPHVLALRVYERGCGETLACGSGAVAAAVVARKYFDAPAHMEVQLPGGVLYVDWLDRQEQVLLRGPAVSVYEGEIDI